jgi:signal transduction histidine kinase
LDQRIEPRAARDVPAPASPGARLPDLARLIRGIDPHAIDALIALALAAAAMAILAGRAGDPAGDFRANDFLGTGLVLLQTLPLAARRVWPLGVAIVVGGAVAAHAALGYEVVQAGTFGSLVAVYGAASLTDNQRALIAAGFTAGALAVFFATTRGDFGPVDMAATSGTWALAWLFGSYLRIRGEQAAALGEHAAWLERDQELRAREAVADERARMAREPHDIVGHALNVIVIQAGGAQRTLETRPQAAREALASIESAGREALSDMERMLGVLRAAADGGQPALGPQPGLAQIETLAAQVSDAGLAVDVAVEGARQELPASIELSAYRIVQEALTNALKHSRGRRARVVVRYAPLAVEVEISDDGRGPQARASAEHGGRGIVGMRERAAVFGGELEVGAASPEGGYRGRARLPLKSAAV